MRPYAVTHLDALHVRSRLVLSAARCPGHAGTHLRHALFPDRRARERGCAVNHGKE